MLFDHHHHYELHIFCLLIGEPKFDSLIEWKFNGLSAGAVLELFFKAHFGQSMALFS